MKSVAPPTETTTPERLRVLAARTGAFRVVDLHRIESATHDWRVTIELAPDAPQVHLLIEEKEAPTAREITTWLDRLPVRDSSRIHVLCADRITTRVADLCRARGVGYLDSGGNCHLRAPGIHLHVEGRSAPTRSSHTTANLFAPKSSRITRVLLGEPRRAWQVQELAEVAGVSIGLASRVKQGLVEAGYVDVEQRLVRLADPRGLLSAWSAAYTPQADAATYYVMSDPDAIVDGVADWCDARAVRYALTGLAAAWRVAPMVRPQATTMYVDPKYPALGQPTLEQALDARRVDSGANLTIHRPQDEYVFHGLRSVRDASVVSAIQLYLDLRRLAGRGEEAAAEVLEKELEPTWRR